MQKKTIRELILEYFHAHPKQKLSHDPVVKWVGDQREKMGYKRPSDPWREIRKLHAEGTLKQHDGRAIYEYDPDYEHETELKDFPESVKQDIFKRDNYRCVVCNLGREDGVSLAADHKKPKSKGGTNTLENGQTLCSKHNLMKKDYGQTTAGKKYFIEIYNTAVANDDKNMIEFCKAVFDTYDDHDMNGHIERPDNNP